MYMSPPLNILRRTDPSSSDISEKLSPTYIVGFIIAGLLAFSVVAYVVIRLIRKRLRDKREDTRGAAFLSVRGLVREDRSEMQQKGQNLQTHSGFSRAQLTTNASITMPEKILVNPQEILGHHRANGTVPRPFSISTARHQPQPSETSIKPPSSLNSGKSRFSGFPSFARPSSYFTDSSRVSTPSSDFTASTRDSNPNGVGTSRSVLQLFTPVLPDELLLRTGEKLMVVQSFDDGWCVVARTSPSSALAAPPTPSPFGKKHNMAMTDGVELGVVPAWVFMRPLKGLRTERPVRLTSLGATVDARDFQHPGEDRDGVMSWSNF